MMRYTPAEKFEIIRLVEQADVPAKQVLAELGIARSTFYDGYRRYGEAGYDGLADHNSQPHQFWNRIPDEVREEVVQIALERPELSPRELAWHITDHQGYFISESSTYRILKACDLVTSPVFQLVSAKDQFEEPTTRVNELWQTDFTQLKVVGWGWYYLCTVLDDFSRYIIAWRLAPAMTSQDAKATLDLAVERTAVSHIKVDLRPRLLSDNGAAFVSDELAQYLEHYHLRHIRGAPYHPQTQGKIERYHRSMKSIVKLVNFYFPWELEQAIASFVDYYNQQRYHESLDNLTPSDVFLGRALEVQTYRQHIKQQTFISRRQHNLVLNNYPL
jgi:RNA-directed DNA polymerase